MVGALGSLHLYGDPEAALDLASAWPCIGHCAHLEGELVDGISFSLASKYINTHPSTEKGIFKALLRKPL